MLRDGISKRDNKHKLAYTHKQAKHSKNAIYAHTPTHTHHTHPSILPSHPSSRSHPPTLFVTSHTHIPDTHMYTYALASHQQASVQNVQASKAFL